MANKYGVAAWLTAFTLVMLLFIMAPATAEDNIKMRGRLIEPPPCSLDDDGTVTVDFGDKIGVKKVASGIYRQPVNLHLKCEESTQAWQLLLTVRGSAVDFDADKATLMTPQHRDLGVKLYLDGKPFELESAVKINGNLLPDIEAVLVQREGADLTEGPFTAQATMRAEYQ